MSGGESVREGCRDARLACGVRERLHGCTGGERRHERAWGMSVRAPRHCWGMRTAIASSRRSSSVRIKVTRIEPDEPKMKEALSSDSTSARPDHQISPSPFFGLKNRAP